MKSVFSLSLIFVLISCCKKVDNEHIEIDLYDAKDAMEYSSFVDSIGYVTLKLGDIPMGEIKRVYKWKDYFYVWGEKTSGIFIFDDSGKLQTHINKFGEGPEEFRMISAFSVVFSTGDICILDASSQQIKYYAMDGSFLSNVSCSDWSIDIAALNGDCIVFISPYYLDDSNNAGIWMTNGQNRLIKHLNDDVTSDCQFYYYPMTYNMGDTCLYYYDRNWNYFSRISENGMERVYQFDVKQELPPSLMRDTHAPRSSLNGYAICDCFLYSSSRLLMAYCLFDYKNKIDNRTYVWAMLDNRTHQIKLAKKLHNDIDGVEVTSNQIFHLDNQTWAYICDEEEENFDVRLQLLYLK